MQPPERFPQPLEVCISKKPETGGRNPTQALQDGNAGTSADVLTDQSPTLAGEVYFPLDVVWVPVGKRLSQATSGNLLFICVTSEEWNTYMKDLQA